MSATNKNEVVVLRQASFKGTAVTLGQPIKAQPKIEPANITHTEPVPATTPSSGVSKSAGENDTGGQERLLSELGEKYKLENQKILEAEKAKLKKQYDQQMSLLQKQFDTQVGTLNGVIHELNRKSQDFHALLEPAVIRIVQFSLQKILGDVSRLEEHIVMLVKQAILQHSIEEGFVLKVAPADYDVLHKVIQQNDSMHTAKIEIQQDIHLKAGQCLIDLSRCVIDISPELQIQKVGQLLNDE